MSVRGYQTCSNCCPLCSKHILHCLSITQCFASLEVFKAVQVTFPFFCNTLLRHWVGSSQWGAFSLDLSTLADEGTTFLCCLLSDRVDVKLGRWHWGRNMGWGCWGEYLGPKRDGVTGEWRKLHNEELNDLYSSLNIVRVITLRRMRWAGHVARMEEGRVMHKV